MKRDVVLMGSGIALVDMTEADQTNFHAWLQDMELRELIDDPRIPSLEDQKRWFTRVQEPDRKFFSLVTVPEGTLIGNGGFVEINPDEREATLRITIGHKDFRGKGLGSEAVQLLLQYAFTQAKWTRVLLKVLKTNARAIRAYEKAGFRILGEDLQDSKTIITMGVTAKSI